MSDLRRKREDEVGRRNTPLKKGNDDIVIAPLLSQIPYLNGIFDDEATVNEIKPIYVRDTDSEYIRRCKLGGTHDLLMHIDVAPCKSKEPVPYPRPLWWDAMCEDFPSTPNLDKKQSQERKSSKTEHTSDSFVHGEGNHSSAKQQNVPSRQNNSSRQSQLSKHTKRK